MVSKILGGFIIKCLDMNMNGYDLICLGDIRLIDQFDNKGIVLFALLVPPNLFYDLNNV